MDIYIDNRAKEYIRSKSEDNSIQILIENLGGGWCTASQPSVKMGKPYNESSFRIYKVEDINVYIPPSIKVRNDKLKISCSSFFWMKSLNVDGIIL